LAIEFFFSTIKVDPLSGSSISETQNSHDQTTPFLGVYPRELNRGTSNKSVYMNVHSSTIHHGPKVGTSKMSSADEWIRKRGYSYTDYYSATQRKFWFML
jgi:hypothetical protein